MWLPWWAPMWSGGHEGARGAARVLACLAIVTAAYESLAPLAFIALQRRPGPTAGDTSSAAPGSCQPDPRGSTPNALCAPDGPSAGPDGFAAINGPTLRAGKRARCTLARPHNHGANIVLINDTLTGASRDNDALTLRQCTISTPQSLSTTTKPSSVDTRPTYMQLQQGLLSTLFAARPLIQVAHAMHIQRLDAPDSIRAGQPLKLRCLYDFRPDKLQSLAWYKDGHEFYRYQPFERNQPVITFNRSGIVVDLSKSKSNALLLTNTTTETGGRYRCQATENNFREINIEKLVNVVSEPNSSVSRYLLGSHAISWYTIAILEICVSYLLIHSHSK